MIGNGAPPPPPTTPPRHVPAPPPAMAALERKARDVAFILGYSIGRVRTEGFEREDLVAIVNHVWDDLERREKGKVRP